MKNFSISYYTAACSHLVMLTSQRLTRLVLTLFCLAFLTPAISYAQVPCEGANCTSKDIKITSVRLTDAAGVPINFDTQCAGGSGTVAAYLQVNLKVESTTRYGFLITANAVVNGTATPLSFCYSQDFLKGEYPVYIPFTYQCGTSLQLSNVFTAWDNIGPNTTICGYYANNNLSSAECAQITPKCKVYPIPFDVVTCVNPPTPVIGTITQPNCETSTGSVPFNYNSAYTYSLTGTGITTPQVITGSPITGLAPGTYSLVARNGNCSSSGASIVINAVPTAPIRPVLSITEPRICGPATGSITVSCPTGSNYEYRNGTGAWQPSATFSGLAAGSNYSIQVRDINTRCVSAATDCNSAATTCPTNLVPNSSVGAVKTLDSSQRSIRSEAFPNPTGRDATINFSVPKSGHVKVQVYNALGTRVATLFDGVAKGGVNNKVLLQGSKLPTGTYYYKVTSDGKTKTNRISLVK